MLCDETIIRTPTEDRPLSTLRTGDTVYDSHNEVITVTIGPSELLVIPHRVAFLPYHWSHNMYHDDETIASFIVNEEHELHLVAPKYGSAITIKRRRHPQIRTLVMWHTRCIGHTTPEESTRQELDQLRLPGMPPHPLTRLRPRGEQLAAITSPGPLSSSPSTDTSFMPSSQVGEDLDMPGQISDDEERGSEDNSASNASHQTDDEDNALAQAPSSDAFVRHVDYSPDVFAAPHSGSTVTQHVDVGPQGPSSSVVKTRHRPGSSERRSDLLTWLIFMTPRHSFRGTRMWSLSLATSPAITSRTQQVASLLRVPT
jgi:hypothetical protein